MLNAHIVDDDGWMMMMMAMMLMLKEKSFVSLNQSRWIGRPRAVIWYVALPLIESNPPLIIIIIVIAILVIILAIISSIAIPKIAVDKSLQSSVLSRPQW